MNPYHVTTRIVGQLRRIWRRRPSSGLAARSTRSALQLEGLESRQFLSATSGSVSDISQLTLSFAPDGTDIGGHSSALFETLQPLANEQAWKETILRAFQTWTTYTTANIGVTPDGGQPFGTSGPRIQDPRFGDIRIGARPLSPDTRAISISQGTVVSGTWAGDVILNSDAVFEDLDQLFSVILHEAGHVLGLEHSDDPTSPMYAQNASATLLPTAEDIDELRRLHGQRLPDPNEGPNGNETLRTATPLDPLIPAPARRNVPAVVFGDITTPDDVDVFALESPGRYRGSVTIRLQSRGVSLLAPSLQVLTRAGREVARTASAQAGGTTLLLRLDELDPQESYFLRVTAARPDVFGVGSYSLVVSLDDLPQADSARVDDVVAARLRHLSQGQLKDLLGGSRRFLNEDDHQNDDRQNATRLTVRPGFQRAGNLEAIGSLSDRQDVDYYRFEVPAENRRNVQVVQLSLRSLEPGRLVPQATLFDQQHNRLPSEVLVNGNGEFVLQAELAPRQAYVVRIEAAVAPSPFATGNYRLHVTFPDEAVHLETFATGAVDPSQPQRVHQLHVARIQLLHLALDARAVDSTDAQGLIAQLTDSQGAPLLRLAARTGDTRTAPSLLLLPGTYLLHIRGVAWNGSLTSHVPYRVRGTSVSDPFAVDPDDPTADPQFQCPGQSGVYCYPGGVESPDPYLWDEFLEGLPAVPDLDPVEMIDALLGDWWMWYWQQAGENGPPLAQDDTYQTDASSRLEIDATQGVLANDIEPEQEGLAAVLLEEVQFGQLTLQADGSFLYVPEPGFVGTDEFTYLAYDFRQSSEPATVRIEVVAGPAMPGDLDGDGQVGLQDIELLRQAIQQGQGGTYDLNDDGQLDQTDLDYLVRNVLNTSVGDVNLDGRFDSSDLVAIFQAGLYETEVSGSAQWATGDWNCDGQFTSTDLVLAFQQGGYTAAAAAAPRSMDRVLWSALNRSQIAAAFL